MPPKPTETLPEAQTPPALPETPPSQPSAETPPSQLKPFEQWAAEKNTADWQLAALKAFKNYPNGREISSGEFDAALKEALMQPVG